MSVSACLDVYPMGVYLSNDTLGGYEEWIKDAERWRQVNRPTDTITVAKTGIAAARIRARKTTRLLRRTITPITIIRVIVTAWPRTWRRIPCAA
ncbi:protein of unknown function [Hyphomicrobium sp. MC1]|nr:protein of unknown function [Hyphomicrobium sp. MC1]